MSDIVELLQVPYEDYLRGYVIEDIKAEAAVEILRLRAENEKLRAELEAIKSPPDYGTQKTMNEQLHYASVIAQKDREIERLRSAAAALGETGDE